MKNRKEKLLGLLLVALVCVVVHVFNPVHHDALREKSRTNGAAQNEAQLPTVDIKSVIVTKYFDDVRVEQNDSVCFTFYDMKGDVAGKALNSNVVGKNITGYGGNTPILIVLDENERVKGVELLPNAESAGFVERIKKSGFFDQWNGKTLKEVSEFTPDAVSGATITSEAVIQNVALLANLSLSYDFGSAFDWHKTLKLAALLVLITISIVACFNAPRFAKFRMWLLVASIAVIGLWLGEFLSIQSFYTWLKGGFVIRYTMLLLLTVAVVMPLFFSKPIYCFYLCPFGALQELVGKITKKKVQLSDNVVFYLNLVKKMYLVTIIVLALSVINIDFTNFEPFTVFMWQSVSITVIVMASVILLLSLFISRPWCKYGCPTGLVLNVLNKGLKWKKK